MNAPSSSFLQLDILTGDAWIAGFLDAGNQNRRLVDILNLQDTYIEVVSATLGLTGSQVAAQDTNSVLVEKRDILLAMPHETPEQVRQRRLARSGIMPSAANAAVVGFLLPGFYVRGTVRVSSGAARVKLDPTAFARFFVVTDAQVTRADGQTHAEEFVIVHREAVTAFALPHS